MLYQISPILGFIMTTRTSSCCWEFSTSCSNTPDTTDQKISSLSLKICRFLRQVKFTLWYIVLVWPPLKFDYQTDSRRAEGQTMDKVIIVVAFWGMHVSTAKHSYVWLPRKCDYRTDTHTDRRKDRQTPDKVIR